ncbi:MAG: ferritin-like domain-containing protein [Myxococcales bacterium]|nr:ferritin-like domain-containing protein [Myxococcales bacterium]
MQRRALSTVIRGVALAVLGAGCGSVGSTSDGGTSDGGTSEGGTPGGPCRPPATFEDVRLPVAVDYIGARREAIDATTPQGDGGPLPDAGLVAQWKASQSEGAGTPCGTATDPAKCQAALAALRILPEPADPASCRQNQAGPPEGCLTSYIVFTRGDTVGKASTLAEAKALFGPIDTPGEAWLMSRFFGGGSPLCSTKYPNLVPRATATATGYDLSFPYANCFVEEEVSVKVATDGTVTPVARKSLPADPCAIGRRPEGLVAQPDAAGAPSVGRFFARAAELEGASVVSFRRLAGELARAGAPQRLVRRAKRAARDEVRHARVTARLARRHGVSPLRPRVEGVGARGLNAVARENAVEGCVRETYGAVVAHVQAARAEDPTIRAAMSAIAADETRHAELSWRLHRWSLRNLTGTQRDDVRRAMTEAVSALRAELRVAPEAELAKRAGVPSPALAASLMDELERTIWA